MKKFSIVFTSMVLLLLLPSMAGAQNNLKVRIFGNTTRFMSEPQGEEVLHPETEDYNVEYGPFDDFTHQGGLGIGAELMISLSEKAWFGLEVSSNSFKGYNDNPPYYNILKTNSFHQLRAKGPESETWDMIIIPPLDSLKYSTSMMNILANFRFYLSTSGKFRPFIKIHSGVSLIATELAYNTKGGWPPDNVTIILNDGTYVDPTEMEFSGPVIYSRGTTSSPEGRLPALNLGGGVGFEYQINDRLSLYADATLSMINSDIVDGRPNFDYNPDKGYLEPFNTFGNTGKLSFGVCYTIAEGLNIFGGAGKGGSGKSGRQHPYLPFYNMKRAR